MSNEKEKPLKAEPNPGKVVEQPEQDDMQHGRNAQRPDVNPSTNVQKGHRDREEI